MRVNAVTFAPFVLIPVFGCRGVFLPQILKGDIRGVIAAWFAPLLGANLDPLGAPAPVLFTFLGLFLTPIVCLRMLKGRPPHLALLPFL